MKIASIFPCCVLVCVIFLLGSCTAYQKAQWSQGGTATAPAIWSGGQEQGGGCPHRPNMPNYMGIMSGSSIYSMRNEFYPFCHKCRH